MPSGEFLMDDLFGPGGCPRALAEVGTCSPDAITVTGSPLVEYLVGAPIWDDRP